MNVRLGWSGEVHGTWTKMDVEVDETDLYQHFADADVEDPASLPISPVEKFKLMYALAEIFVQLHKQSRYPEYFGTQEHKQELQALIEARDILTAKIKERTQ